MLPDMLLLYLLTFQPQIFPDAPSADPKSSQPAMDWQGQKPETTGDETELAPLDSDVVRIIFHLSIFRLSIHQIFFPGLTTSRVN